MEKSRNRWIKSWRKYLIVVSKCLYVKRYASVDGFTNEVASTGLNRDARIKAGIFCCDALRCPLQSRCKQRLKHIIRKRHIVHPADVRVAQCAVVVFVQQVGSAELHDAADLLELMADLSVECAE